MSANPDARLLAECERLLAAEAAFRLTCDEDWEDGIDQAAEMRGRAAAALTELLPVTLAGVRAMAKVVWASHQPDPPCEHDEAGPMLWTVIATLAEAEMRS